MGRAMAVFDRLRKGHYQRQLFTDRRTGRPPEPVRQVHEVRPLGPEAPVSDVRRQLWDKKRRYARGGTCFMSPPPGDRYGTLVGVRVTLRADVGRENLLAQ